MPGAKGKRQIKHDPEEREVMVERVCNLYESQHATIASCCKAAGISYQSFNLWCNKFEELGDRYKKAKAKQKENYWQDIIRPLLKAALIRHLAIEETTIVMERNVLVNGIPTGQKIRITTRKQTLPNVTVLIFIMKALYPERFVHC
jgi:hypothetical protein